MALKFVPGAVNPFDAGAIASKASNWMLDVKESGQESEALVIKIRDDMEKVEETWEPGIQKDQMLSIMETQASQAHDIYLRTQAIRIAGMRIILSSMSTMITITYQNLQQSSLDEEDFGDIALYEQNLLALESRFVEVYADFLKDKGLSLSDEMSVDDIAEAIRYWPLTQWWEYETQVENPVLYWNIKECQDNWDISGRLGASMEPPTAPCKGPDYWYTWMLSNQLAVAHEAQYQAVEQYANALNFFFDSTMASLRDSLMSLAKEAGEVAGEAFGTLVSGAVEGAKRGLGDAGRTLLIGGALVGAGYLFFKYMLGRMPKAGA